MIIAIKLLSWLWPIAGNVYLDRNGAKRNYLQVNLIRGMFAIAHGILVLPKDYNYSSASSLDLLLIWLPLLVFEFTSYWIFFELGLNIVRHRKLLYYDNKEGDSGYIDRFFKWAGPTWHAVAKILCFVLMVLSIIVIYENY
jgi:hypothetical protein